MTVEEEEEEEEVVEEEEAQGQDIKATHRKAAEAKTGGNSVSASRQRDGFSGSGEGGERGGGYRIKCPTDVVRVRARWRG